MPHPALLLPPGYADLIRNTPGLIAYWRMRDYSSATVTRNELSTAGATLTNAPVPAPGPPIPDSASIKFNGSNQSLSAAINLSTYTQLSLSFWFWWDALITGDHIVLEHGVDGGAGHRFFIDANLTSRLTILLGHGSGVYMSKYLTVPSAAAWHHYLITLSRPATVDIGAWVDGSNASLTLDHADNGGTGSFENQTLFMMAGNNASLRAAGRLAVF